MISGVPQGTVLGPVLFVMYINDLLESIHSSKGLGFADDTKLIGAISGMESVTLLQEDLNTVIESRGQESTTWSFTRRSLRL